MADIKISDLPTEGSPVDGGLLEVASPSSGSFASRKLTLSALYGYILSKIGGYPRTISQSGVPVSVTGTTAETTLATINIPAGAMGANGFIEIVPLLIWTNSANSKTVRIKIGGQEMWSISQTTNAGVKAIVTINNSGSQSVQRGSVNPNGLGVFSVAVPVGSVNTANATTVTITGTLANAADTITLDSWLARLTFSA